MVVIKNCLKIKKMLIEIILCVIAITPYIIIFMFFNHFQYIINTMSDINEFFSDVVDTPAEAVDQSNKRKKLKDLIDEGKADLLKGKTPWTVGRIDKASDKVIDRLFDEYQQPTEVVEKKKIFDQEDIKLAQEVGEVCFPLIVELYAEGLSVIMQSTPYIKDKYKLNTDILRNKLEANNRLRVRISIKVGQKIVERFGTDAVLAMTVLRDTRSAISIINEDILKATVDSLELVEE